MQLLDDISHFLRSNRRTRRARRCTMRQHRQAKRTGHWHGLESLERRVLLSALNAPLDLVLAGEAQAPATVVTFTAQQVVLDNNLQVVDLSDLDGALPFGGQTRAVESVVALGATAYKQTLQRF